MKSKSIVLLALAIFVALAFFNLAQAVSHSPRNAITFNVGMFAPSMKWTIDVTSPYSGTGNYTGPNSKKVSFGIGILPRNSSGTRVRIAYQYRPEARIVYTKYKTTLNIEGHEYKYSLEYSEDEAMKLRYSMHTVSLSVMKSITIHAPLNLYLGGGGEVILLTYSNEVNSTGFSGFPLVGLEFLFGPKIGLYSEYQHHFGRTLNKHVNSSTASSYYSLTGPNILGGVNLYF